jgi:hypothetical protein
MAATMTDHECLLRIVSETLGGEVVWNVVVSKVERVELLAIDKGNAEQLAHGIAKLIDRHAISGAKVVWARRECNDE